MDWDQADRLLEGLEGLIRRYQLETKVIRWSAETRGEPISEATLKELDDIFNLVERMNSRAVRLVRAIVKGAEQREEWWQEELRRSQDRLEDVLATVASAQITDSFDPRGCFVYCLWGKDPDRPIYVGQSTNVLTRLGAHVVNPALRPQIRRITLLRCKNEHQMNRIEAALISRYQPPENIYGIRETPSEKVERQAQTTRGLARAMMEVFRDELAEEERLRPEDRSYFSRLNPSGTPEPVDSSSAGS